MTKSPLLTFVIPNGEKRIRLGGKNLLTSTVANPTLEILLSQGWELRMKPLLII